MWKVNSGKKYESKSFIQSDVARVSYVSSLGWPSIKFVYHILHSFVICRKRSIFIKLSSPSLSLLLSSLSLLLWLLLLLLLEAAVSCMCRINKMLFWYVDMMRCFHYYIDINDLRAINKTEVYVMCCIPGEQECFYSIISTTIMSEAPFTIMDK